MLRIRFHRSRRFASSAQSTPQPRSILGHPRAAQILPALIIAICLSLSCNHKAGVNGSGEQPGFTDSLGRKVSVKANPQRIISLAPSVTEILFALNLGD